jgi:hypothetical protein
MVHSSLLDYKLNQLLANITIKSLDLLKIIMLTFILGKVRQWHTRTNPYHLSWRLAFIILHNLSKRVGVAT